jgi:hypothetical protein
MSGGASGFAGRDRKALRFGKALQAGAVLAGAFACQGGFAQMVQESVQDNLPPRVEVVTSTMPRFDAQRSPADSRRIDMTLLPHDDSGMGFSVGMSGFAQPIHPMGAGLLPTAQPSVDVGLHWRQALDSTSRIDVTAWHRVTPQMPDAYTLVQNQEATYGARVELNLGSAGQKGFFSDKGFLGFQLDNGRQFTVRRKDGHPMLYYRVKF